MTKTARELARALKRTARKLRADPRLARVERGRRDRCWCGGELLPFPHHRRYGVCAECGTYVNRQPPTEAALRSFYSLDRYWHRKQRADLLPPIEERVAIDAMDGRIDHWLGLVERYGRPSGTVVEIGCSHGLLLERLTEAGYSCVGIEVDPAVAAWTQARSGVEIRAGLFPAVDVPECDVFLSFDVLEHSADPLAFLQRASDLLRPGGIAVLQAPIERERQDPPFGGRFADAFDDVEHLFVFTDRALRELARRTGLDVVDESDRLWLLGEIVVLRKPS